MRYGGNKQVIEFDFCSYRMNLFLLFIMSLRLVVAYTPLVNREKHFNLSHPIINLGLMKSGTTTLTNFLRRCGIMSEHYFANEVCCQDMQSVPRVVLKDGLVWEAHNNIDKCYVGAVIQKELSEGRRPLSCLLEHDIISFTQMDTYQLNLYPQLEAIDTILDSYPEAYYLHTTRENPFVHADSIMNWFDLSDAIKNRSYLNLLSRVHDLDKLSDFDKMVHFVRAANGRVRAAFQRRGRGAYKVLNVQVHRPGEGRRVASFLGIEEEVARRGQERGSGDGIFEMDVSNEGQYVRRHWKPAGEGRVSDTDT